MNPGIIDVVGRALDRLDTLRANSVNVETARFKLEQAKQSVDIDKKINAAKLDRALLDGAMTRNDYNLQSAAMKEYEKQQKAVLEGSIAQNDMAQHATVKEAESLSQVIQKLGSIAAQEEAAGEDDEVDDEENEDLVPGGYQASILGGPVRMSGGHMRPRLASDQTVASLAEKRRAEAAAKKEDLATSGVIADIEEGFSGDIDIKTAESAKRHAMRKLGSGWEKKYPQVGKIIGEKFGDENTKIKVKAPDGTIGYIKQGKINEAKQRGFSVVED